MTVSEPQLAVGGMRTMYLAIPKIQADTDRNTLIENWGDARRIRYDNNCFDALEPWSTRTQKSAFIPMCDTVMGAWHSEPRLVGSTAKHCNSLPSSRIDGVTMCDY